MIRAAGLYCGDGRSECRRSVHSSSCRKCARRPTKSRGRPGGNRDHHGHGVLMVAIASIFFLLADQVMRFIVTLVLESADDAANGCANGFSDHDQALVYRPSLFEFRAEGCRFDPRKGQAAPPHTFFEEIMVPRRRSPRCAAAGRWCRAKFFPGYVLVRWIDRRGLPPHQERTVTGSLRDNKPLRSRMPKPRASCTRLQEGIERPSPRCPSRWASRCGCRRPVRVVQRHRRGVDEARSRLKVAVSISAGTPVELEFGQVEKLKSVV